MKKNTINSRIPRIDSIGTTVTSRIPLPNISKTPASKLQSHLSRKAPDTFVEKTWKPSKLQFVRQKSDTDRVVPQESTKDAAKEKDGTFSLQNEQQRLLPCQTIDDEVISLVGSTDCLNSACELEEPPPPAEAKPKPNYPEVLTKPAKTQKHCDTNSTITIKSKKGETAPIINDKSKKKLEQSQSCELETPNRTVLLKRDNTFDIIDNKILSRVVTKVQTPQQLILNVTHDRTLSRNATFDAGFDSPGLSSTRELGFVSTPRESPVNFTFELESTQNLTKTLTKCDQIDLEQLDRTLTNENQMDQDRTPIVQPAEALKPDLLSQDFVNLKKNKCTFSRFSGETTLSCSFDFVDSPVRTEITDSNSFEIDESLGILTPDQMKEIIDTATTSTNRQSLDLPLNLQINLSKNKQGGGGYRMEQTPSPEELPLDPPARIDHLLPSLLDDKKGLECEKSDFSEMTESKTEAKSGSSKVSSNNESVITSVTSITSLDTGCQGDGEMSRPASRNADFKLHSSPIKLLASNPSVVSASSSASGSNPKDEEMVPIVRRQDPMTDSDFFTESDADDVFHRGDRRAQVIDGQLFGPKMAQNVFVHKQPASMQNSVADSCMESSGIFTDAEQQKIPELQFDMSPDDRSTDTMQSNTDSNNSQRLTNQDNSKNNSDNGKKSRNNSESKLDKENEMQITETIPIIIPQETADKTGSTTTALDPDSPENRIVAGKSAGKRMNSKSRRSNSTSPPILKKNKMIETTLTPKPVAKTVVKKTPNKWDAVMNKISNKPPPKDYSVVKSKVNCARMNSALVQERNNSAGSIASHASSKVSPRHLNEKENSAPKRGRSVSKESSHSDISTNFAPRKPQTITRSAKKRDVRTLNGQQTTNDLEPPNKTTSTTTTTTGIITANLISNSNGLSARQVATLASANQMNSNGNQKRSSSQNQNHLIVPDNNNNKMVTPNKTVKRTIHHTSSPSPVIKQPLKEHNRLATPTSAQTRSTITPPGSANSSPKVKLKNQINVANSKKAVTGTVVVAAAAPKKELHDAGTQFGPSEEEQIEESIGLLRGKNYTILDRHQNEEMERIQQEKSDRIGFVEEQLRVKDNGVHAMAVLFNHSRENYDTRISEMKLENMCKLESARLREAELEMRLSEHAIRENELREKVVASEVEYSDKLRAAMIREKELMDRIQQMSDHFEEMKMQSAVKENELATRIKQIQKEAQDKEIDLVEQLNSVREESAAVLRSVSWNGHESTNGHESSPNRTGGHLQVEVESLRSVLDMKINEISELRKENQVLAQAKEMNTGLQIKCSSLESKVEDLQFQLQAKNEAENKLANELKVLSDKFVSEAKHSSRLSIHNEELQWKLKQNCEKFQKTILELSKKNSSDQIDEDDDSFEMDDNSVVRINNGDMSPTNAPQSPTIKGVFKTSDAVSWILEMDDETPEKMASRVIRRVGSFRSGSGPALKRSKSTQNSANPLSQSASAASILRQSSESSPVKKETSLRVRSKSMSVKASEKVSLKKSTKKEGMDNFQDPMYAMYTSSPYKNFSEEPEDVIVISDSEKKMIERKKQVSKNLNFSRKKESPLLLNHCLSATRSKKEVSGVSPKESGGEAMISGSNSEAEDVFSVSSSPEILITEKGERKLITQEEEDYEEEDEEEDDDEEDEEELDKNSQICKLQEMVYASLNSGSSRLISVSNCKNKENNCSRPRLDKSDQVIELWSSSMEEEDDDDYHHHHNSESVA